MNKGTLNSYLENSKLNEKKVNIVKDVFKENNTAEMGYGCILGFIWG